MLHNLLELGGGRAQVDRGVRLGHGVRGRWSLEDYTLTVVLGFGVLARWFSLISSTSPSVLVLVGSGF